MKNLKKGIISLIFLGCISSVTAKTESLPKTQALIHLEKCFSLASDPNTPARDITKEFMNAIRDNGDDPCCFDKLEKIAKSLGASKTKIQNMWCDYGMTDEGHEFFLNQPTSTIEAQEKLVNAIKFALLKE